MSSGYPRPYRARPDAPPVSRWRLFVITIECVRDCVLVWIFDGKRL